MESHKAELLIGGLGVGVSIIGLVLYYRKSNTTQGSTIVQASPALSETGGLSTPPLDLSGSAIFNQAAGSATSDNGVSQAIVDTGATNDGTTGATGLTAVGLPGGGFAFEGSYYASQGQLPVGVNIIPYSGNTQATSVAPSQTTTTTTTTTSQPDTQQAPTTDTRTGTQIDTTQNPVMSQSGSPTSPHTNDPSATTPDPSAGDPSSNTSIRGAIRIGLLGGM